MNEFGVIIAGAALLLLAAYWIDRASGARSRPEAKPTAPEMAFCPQSGTDVIGGCEWEPRYDLGAAQTDGLKVKVDDTVLLETLDRLRQETYIRDVCIKCGRTAERARPVESVAGGLAGGTSSAWRFMGPAEARVGVTGSGSGGSGGSAA